MPERECEFVGNAEAAITEITNKKEMEIYLEPIQVFERNQRDNLGRFKKGHIPFNKGKKCPEIANKTSFKKGHIPHNTKHNGAISYRTHKRDGGIYKYIRVAKGKWELFHRYLWKQHYGEIPEGHIIRFADGNSLNCDINNLECISRAENRNRNINYEKSALSIKETWRKEWLRHIYGLPVKTKLLKRCKI